jgi:hypothetical protein
MAAQGQPKVLQTMKFKTSQEAQQKLMQLGARFRMRDTATGGLLYKTPAGVVLRVRQPDAVEVLSNCVC